MTDFQFLKGSDVTIRDVRVELNPVAVNPL